MDDDDFKWSFENQYDTLSDDDDDDVNKLSSHLSDNEDENSPEFNPSLLDDIAIQNKQGVLEVNRNRKNWIPDNILLTTQDDIPIIYINSITDKPEIYPIKLATITLNAELPINFNLKVIALYIQLDENIIGVKCEGICQRGWFKQKSPSKPKKSKKKGRKDKADFYNQCTINIRPYGNESDELINMKLFPNGKVGFTGVKRVIDAEISLKLILNKIRNLHGPVIYFPINVEWGNAKNFRKKLKQRQQLLQYISDNTQYHVDWNLFINSINTKGKKNPYPNGLQLPNEISYCLTFMEIILTYFELTNIEHAINSTLFTALFNLIKLNFNTNNLSSSEQKIFIHYLAATQKYIIPIDRLINLIKNFTITSKQIILLFYLQNNAHYNIDNISNLLHNTNEPLESISLIQDYLINNLHNTNYSTNDITIINDFLLSITNITIVEDDISDITSNIEDESNIDHDKNDDHNDNDNDIDDDNDIDIDETNQLTTIIDINKNTDVNRFFMDLPAWSDKYGNHNVDIMGLYSSDYINISNINTTFNTNFVLSRKKLHQLLTSKYRQTNCSFEPNYGGIKLTYLSNIDCPEHDDPEDPDIIPELNSCRCKGVSVLIFPNITLITGGRSFRQIIQAYDFIKKVMLTEFTKIIKIEQNNIDPIDKFPNIISSNKNIYIKKKHIIDNLKNHFILKKLGLLDNYIYTPSNIQNDTVLDLTESSQL